MQELENLTKLAALNLPLPNMLGEDELIQEIVAVMPYDSTDEGLRPQRNLPQIFLPSVISWARAKWTTTTFIWNLLKIMNQKQKRQEEETLS